jgi:hypothetical protein
MLEKWIFFWVEKLFTLGDEGRNPMGVVLINFPRLEDEPVFFRRAGNFLDFKRHY